MFFFVFICHIHDFDIPFYWQGVLLKLPHTINLVLYLYLANHVDLLLFVQWIVNTESIFVLFDPCYTFILYINNVYIFSLPNLPCDFYLSFQAPGNSSGSNLVRLGAHVRDTKDDVPVPKSRRVLPEHEGKYKITMPKGTTARSRRIMQQNDKGGEMLRNMLFN